MVPPLWKETPLVNYDSTLLECRVHLKLEMMHPSKSFKYRGISHFMQLKIRENPSSRFVIASGGNAGYAAACVANSLAVTCDVYIPEGASESTLTLLRDKNAVVVVVGRFYQEALTEARKVVLQDPLAVMVPAYDDPLIWEGHSSMISEISNQLAEKPDAIFCSVGGGGLLGGILLGCRNVGWDDVPVIAVETTGSNCFYHSIALNGAMTHTLPDGITAIHDAKNNVSLAHLSSFSSKASGSLGATSPAAAVVRTALDRKGGISCVSIPDELAMLSTIAIAEQHKLLVELACGTALCPAYNKQLFDKLLPPGMQYKQRNVVFIVCGGTKISISDLTEYTQLLKDSQTSSWHVLVNGESNYL